MIDTIKFRIPVSDDFLDELTLNNYTISRHDNNIGFVEHIKIYKDYVVNIYGYVVKLYSVHAPYSKDILYCEFSVPKVVLGSNVYNCSPEQLTEAVDIVYNEFVKDFPTFPTPKMWEVQRLDICQVWKFKTKKECQKYLDYVKFIDYPRKNKHVYKTTVMWSGRSYTLRMYSKEEEYRKNDYKRLKNYDIIYADKTLELSKNVLRFEVELRKPELIRIFHKPINYVNLLSYVFFLNSLAYYLSRYYFMTLPIPSLSTITIFNNVFKIPKIFIKEKSDLSDFSSGVVTPLEIINFIKGGDNYL